MKIVEIACNNFQSSLNAYRGGADRIELFENSVDGGCTPSFGMMKKVKETIPLPIYVMIRPRGGNFNYTDEEFEIMKYDIILCREVGIDGIVFGILDENREVDVARCSELLKFWNNDKVTFHRAIDASKDIMKSAEDILKLGFERILTSGGKATAEEGLDSILALKEKYGNAIKFMPGSGITDTNVHRFKDFDEVHATCKVKQKSNLMFESILYSDEQKVRNLVDKVKKG